MTFSSLFRFAVLLMTVAVPAVAQTSTTARLANIRICTEFSGADAGAKISACLADLPPSGGIADARGFEGTQSATTTITIDKPARLLLGGMTLISSASRA